MTALPSYLDTLAQNMRAVHTPLSPASRVSAWTSEPEPLRRPLPPAEPYPIDALGDLLGGAARAIQTSLGLPPALAGQSVLAAASLAVQSLADVDIDGRIEPVSLYCVDVAESGERKSAADALALRAHREFERAALIAHAAAMAEHSIELHAYDAAMRAAAKGGDRSAIQSQLHDIGAAPIAPPKPLLLVGSPTLEGLHLAYTTGMPSIGLFHDDAAEFLGGHAMSPEHRAKTAAGLSRLWDRGEFDRVRAGDGAMKYHGRRLAMHLMMQPVIAETILSDDMLVGQGLLARCLMTWPASTIGTRAYREVDITRDAAMVRYWVRMAELLAITPTLRDGARNELAPRQLRLSPAAKQAWIAIYSAIEADMMSGGAYAGVRAWASKAPAQVLRVAAVLTLVADSSALMIEHSDIDRAATIVHHHLDEAVRIIGTAAVPQDTLAAEALLEWCHVSGIDVLHSAAALRLGPGRIRTRANFDRAVAELERAGWAAAIDGGCVIDGAHRRRAWAIRGAA